MKELRAAVEILTQYYRIQKALMCMYLLISLSRSLAPVYLKQSIAYNDKLANSQVGGVIKADV